MRFEVTEEQTKQIKHWLRKVVYPAVVAKQKETNKAPTMFHRDCWIQGIPYEGAIGGGLSYCFSPTSLGDVLVVKYNEHELNVTDYESW